MTEPKTVTISKAEYDEMQERLRWLDALESAGVDNWQGFDYALELLEEENEQR